MIVKLHQVLLAVLCALVLGTSTASARPSPKTTNPAERLFVGLIDQDVLTINDGRFNDRYILVNFVFTGCGATCPLQTAELARFDKKLPSSLRDKVKLLSISVDPINDTPDRLKDFARQYQSDTSRWTFATGNPDNVYSVLKTFAAMRPGDNDPGLHTTEVYLFDLKGRMIQRYSGTPLASQQLKTDLEALMEMAS